MHRERFCRAVLGSLLVGLVIAGIAFVWYQGKCDERIRAIRAQLGATRKGIEIFQDANHRYPESLHEFRGWVLRNGGQNWARMFVDLTSKKQERVPEYRELSGSGGYYYDSCNGEIRLNLTQPVGEYLRWYTGDLKDDIPSFW